MAAATASRSARHARCTGSPASPRSTPRWPPSMAWPSSATARSRSVAARAPRALPVRSELTVRTCGRHAATDPAVTREWRGRSQRGLGHAGQPRDDGVRDRRATGPSWPRYFDLVDARRRRRQVAGRLRVGRQPGAAPAPDAAGDAQRRRAAGPRRAVLARPRAARPRCATGATVVASIWGRSVEDYARAAELWPPPRRRSSPSRSTCRARTSKDGESIFAHDAELTAAVDRRDGARAADPLGQAEPEHRPHRRHRARRQRQPAPRP